MDINKCKTCKYYEPFFLSCNLYIREVYLDEGDFDVQPVGVKEIGPDECKYEKKDYDL